MVSNGTGGRLAAPGLAGAVVNSLMQTLRSLGPVRLTAMAGVGLALLGFLIFGMTRVATPSMELLYGNLEPGDAKRITAELEQTKVPYEVRNNGGDIFVPGDQALKLRVKLAETAVPGGASVGYELFDKQGALGATNFMQNLNLVRALEGELSRTVSAIDGVKKARVHLVLPRRELFTREEQKPSASVVLRMKGSGRLGKPQVAAIQNLVAAAVPKLEPNSISIIDEKGTLLARAYSSTHEYMASTAEEMRREHETRLVHAIEDLLSRSLGPGKVRAEVSVELDLDRVVSNQEIFDPNGQVVRNTVTVEDKAQQQEKEPDSITVGANLPDAGLNGSARAQSSNNRTEETVNYEITKKVVNQVRESAVIKRISAAVMVDGDMATENGQKAYRERTVEDLKKLTALVQSAVGFNEDRGDRIDVVNMRFASIDDTGDKPEYIFLNYTKEDMAAMLEKVGLAVLAVLVILLVVRPLITRAFEYLPAQAEAQRKLMEQQQMAKLAGPGLKALAPGGEPPAEFEGDELIDIDKVEGRVRASSLKKIGEIVDKHPEEALSIVRNWLYQEGGA